MEGNACEKTFDDYLARYDLTYLTPCGHEIRCKVSSKCIALNISSTFINSALINNLWTLLD